MKNSSRNSLYKIKSVPVLIFILLLSGCLKSESTSSKTTMQSKPEQTSGQLAPESGESLARKLLPAGHLLLSHSRQPFGDDQGYVFVFTHNQNQAIWYAAETSMNNGYKTVVVREDPISMYFDAQINHIFSAGQQNDLVVLETHSRPAASGGYSESFGSVFRLENNAVRHLKDLSDQLANVTSESEARTILKASLK